MFSSVFLPPLYQASACPRQFAQISVMISVLFLPTEGARKLPLLGTDLFSKKFKEAMGKAKRLDTTEKINLCKLKTP